MTYQTGGWDSFSLVLLFFQFGAALCEPQSSMLS